MKNRKLLFVLLPLTLAVWGMAVYRIYKTVHTGTDAPLIKTLKSSVASNRESISDTFSIFNNYRDPFYAAQKMVDKNTAPAKKAGQSATIIKPSEKEMTAAWPRIQYSGTIRNQRSNTQLALVQVDGNTLMMGNEEVSGNLKICRIFKDSIEIMFQKQKRIFRKIN